MGAWEEGSGVVCVVSVVRGYRGTEYGGMVGVERSALPRSQRKPTRSSFSASSCALISQAAAAPVQPHHHQLNGYGQKRSVERKLRCGV